MANRGRNENPLLNATCYLVVEAHERAQGAPPSGFHFNKYLSLLNKETGDTASPLHLPHSWYRWGDEVQRHLMPADLDWNHEDPPFTTVGWGGDAPDVDLDGPVFKYISTRIEELVAAYSTDGALPELIAAVYQYAPFHFQDRYRELRQTYLDLKWMNLSIEGVHEAVVRKTFQKAIQVFPTQEFPSFAPKVEPFEHLMHGLIDQEHEGLRLAREASEAFWFGFCYHLRLHERAHDNIPRETLEYWRERLPSRMRHYENSFDSLVLEAADKLPRIQNADQIRALVKEAEHRRDDDERFFDEANEDLKTLGPFLDAMRRKRRGANR